MLDSEFQIIYLAGWVVASIIRQKYAKQSRKNTIVDNRKTGPEKYIAIPGIVCLVIIPPLFIFTPLLDFADYTLPDWLGWIGVGVYAAALWLYWRSLVDLGRNWSISVQLRDDHTLVTQGVYRHLRHPLYASCLYTGIATALLLHNWIAGFSLLALFALVYPMRVGREEKMMLDHFGQEYQEYMTKTGRLFPRL